MSIMHKLLGDPSLKSGYVDPQTGARRATPWIERTDDGIYTSTNRSVWVYRVLENVPLRFEDDDALLDHGGRVRQILADIGQTSLTTPPFMQEAPPGFYRNIHIATIRWHHWPEPPPGTPTRDLAAFIADEILSFSAPAQAVFFGVELITGDARARARANNFFDFAKDMVNDLFNDNPTDYTRFDRDLNNLLPILKRNDCRTPTRDEMRQLEAWFTNGSTAEPEIIAYPDHLVIDRDDHLEFSALERLNQKVFRAPHSEWLSDIMDHPDGPSIVSIRAELQPSADTRKALRKSIRSRNLAEKERQKANKEEMVEETEDFELTRLAEGLYSHSDSDPSLRNVSIVFGHRGDGDDVEESYIDYLRHSYHMDVKPLTHKQIAALDEVQPGSVKRGSPFPLHVSLSTVAYAGIGSFTDIGDPEGAFLGRGLPDGTPVYFDFLASSKLDMPPATFIAGIPGSGKATHLNTLCVTPLGFTRMGDIKVGDDVVGRDGKPCRVRGIWEHDNLEFYDVRFSDGQVVRACVDHQWLVHDRRKNLQVTSKKRAAAVERWHATMETADLLELEAGRVSGESTCDELLGLLRGLPVEVPWDTYIGVYAALSESGCPSRIAPRQVEVEARDAAVEQPITTTLYDVEAALVACVVKWSSPRGRWAEQIAARHDAAKQVLADVAGAGEWASQSDLARLVLGDGADQEAVRSLRQRIVKIVRDAQVPSRAGETVAVSAGKAAYVRERDVVLYPTDVALKHLAGYLRANAGERPLDEPSMRVMTVGAMLEEGHKEYGAHSRFSVPVAEPLDLPDADLPVAPYTFGAWLGDGSSNGGAIAAARTVTDSEMVSDQQQMLSRIGDDGYEAWVVESSRDKILLRVEGLTVRLREAGALNNKHIPMLYLRASYDQRLAVLQGLMDTDGTISVDGNCHLALCNERLAADALALIRTLGIKASMTQGEAAIVEDDPDRPGEKRRRVTGPCWNISFTTTRPVFRLPRKAERLPEDVRATQDRIYITDIVAVPSEPGRCIQVDSPDHTYLVEGCVPTHNTFMSLHLSMQAALSGLRVAFVNPKGMDTLRSILPYMESYGIETEWVAISRLAESGGQGTFDPFRYAATPETAAMLGANLITTVLDFDQEQRTALRHGLMTGAKNGAGCVGQAMEYVKQQSPYVYAQVRAFWESTPMFGLCMGYEPKPRMVGAARERIPGELGKFLLTEFDVEMNLPNGVKENYTDAERIGLAAVRAVTTANIGMLAGTQGGVFMMDEAHNVLGHPDTINLIQKIMREGRSLNVAQIYVSQLVSDLLKVGSSGASLESYISRAFALRMTDPVEAAAALKLIGYEPNEDRIATMRQFGAKKTPEGIQPALGYFRDLHGRKSVVSFGPYAESFARAASTNIVDRQEREKEDWA
jgi:hypothetical protein